jgi:protein transport protein SEC61 subunit alpha
VRKLFAILIAAALPVSNVLVSTIAGKHSTGLAILVVLQLFSGGVVVIYLDELLRKGYGFLSSIPLFTATNIW